MPISAFRIILGVLLTFVWLPLWSTPASAQTYGTCTVSPATMNLGSISSYAAVSESAAGSGATGLACTTLLTLAAPSYIKVKVDNSSFLLTGPGGQTLSFTLSSSPGGTPLGVGSEADFSTTALLSLFSGPNNSIPLYIATSTKSGLAAGTYTGTLTLRWYFSVCIAGALTVCLSDSRSPGLTRNAITSVLTGWGTGVPVTVSITLNVTRDCQITAPGLSFGTAPLVGSFNPVTRTISIRCTRDTPYTVGLGDGMNFSGVRRMRQGSTSNYLRYEIYRGNSAGTGRWGSALSGERRSSATADSYPGIYDSSTLQGYSYSAIIDPAQITPPPGTYTDTVVIDVAF